MLKINQRGIKPGPMKLVQFRKAFQLTNTPALYTQEDNGMDATVHVKLFDPTGSATWYITEFSEVAPDGATNLAFGYVTGMCEDEWGYIDISELSEATGRLGIGIEIDIHFEPKPIRDVLKR